MLTLAVAPQAVAARPTPVFGSADFLPGDYDRGYGTARPRVIDNGGAPSGVITKIRWKHWGKARAVGWGRTSIYRPQGGYYSASTRIKLRAVRIGPCAGKRAYRALKVRVPTRPGGPLGPWQWWMGRQNLCTY